MIHASVAIWLLATSVLSITPAQRKVQLYQKALKMVKQSRYQEASAHWQRLIGLFAQEMKKHPRQSRAYNQEIVGQCHVMYQLAETQWKAGARWASCRTRVKLENSRKSISPRWLKHVSDGSLPRLFLASRTRLRTLCQKLPSEIKIQVKPANATIRYKLPNQKEWRLSKARTITVATPKISLKVSAPGFWTQVRQDFDVPRWQRVEVAFTLQRGPTTKPMIRRIIRPRPPKRTLPRRTVPRARVVPGRPPARGRAVARIAPRTRPLPAPVAKPIYQKWWFWTITGLAVAGGATAIIVVAYQASNAPGFVHDPDRPVQISPTP